MAQGVEVKRIAAWVVCWLAGPVVLRAEPRLILVLSIDQMRYDYLTRFQPLYQDGFKTLLERGAVFTNAHYRHSNSETGPGHSVILTGRHATSTGIVTNAWYDPYLKKQVNVVDDPAHSPVGGPGRGASPANLLGFTVGDKVKQKWPQSKVVGVSLKDRSAILMTGHRADAAYWYENPCGCFITSTYYFSQPPAWLAEFNGRKQADRYFHTPWTRLLPDTAVYEKYAGPDDVPGEWDLKDTTFPHPHRGKPPETEYYDNLRRTPFADQIVLEAALEILKFHDLGTDASPDILAVGFSGSDVIGHTYGPYSQEVLDEYVRLDRILGKLLRAVEAQAGAGNVLVILTADHGGMPLVEWLQKHGVHAKRFRASLLDEAVRKALEARFSSAPGLVADFDSPNFTLNIEAVRKHGLRQSEVERVAIAALLATGAVARVYTHQDMLSEPPAGDPYFQLFRNSFFQPRTPHLMVLQKKYTYIDNRVGGTGHGTAYEYDRHVPIIWMAPGIKPGRHSAPAGPEDIAPTLARMLGIEYPLEYDSRLLTEVLP
jgi:predicted AlkP superfamily pyrophosphatase or phosphodiesterase